MEFGFLLKKTISFFVHPFGFIFTLLLLTLFLFLMKKELIAKYLLGLSSLSLFLFSYPPISNYLVSSLENRYEKYPYSEDVKYIHILGSGHNTDSTQPLSSQVSSAGLHRIIEGVMIHKNIPDSKIICTGYGGKTDTPTAVMCQRVALALGVDIQDVILGVEAKDTEEEAVFNKSIVKDEKFVLVTSATHMDRSMNLFQSYGLNPIAAPTNFYKTEDNGWFQAPNIDSLRKSQIAIHEYIGSLYFMLKSFRSN